MPTESVEVGNVACPVLSRVAVPSTDAPSLKVTVPEMAPATFMLAVVVLEPRETVTAAVRVTTWPALAGFTLNEVSVSVESCWMVSAMAVEELELFFASPL